LEIQSLPSGLYGERASGFAMLNAEPWASALTQLKTEIEEDE